VLEVNGCDVVANSGDDEVLSQGDLADSDENARHEELRKFVLFVSARDILTTVLS